MYIFGLSSVLFIQKLSAGKEFKLVKRGFGQKIRNTLRNSMRQIWKQKQFYSNSKKNTGVSFVSYTSLMVFILLIFITMPVNTFFYEFIEIALTYFDLLFFYKKRNSLINLCTEVWSPLRAMRIIVLMGIRLCFF